MNIQQITELLFLEPLIPELSKIRRQYHHINKETFFHPKIYLLPKSDIMKFPLKTTIDIHKYLDNNNLTHYAHLVYHFGYTGPYYLNLSAFYPTIKMLGTDEQFAKWEKLILEMRVVGGYAQTELGHGSDVQSLQTKATFDENEKCFILETPGTSSLKWWPGMLGIHATHVVAQAKMFVKGKNYGLQTFIIPLRDLKNMKSLDGVNVGDIGQKFGLNLSDNGYLALNKVKVPLENLMMRYIIVTSDGKVEKNVDENATRLGYASMLNLRTILIKYFLADTLRTVLINHDHFILQSTPDNTTIVKFINSMSYIYTSLLTSQKLIDMFTNMTKQLKVNINSAMDIVKELHILNSGFKAAISWNNMKLMRDMMGDNPLANLYLMGVVGIYADQLPTVTYEGDNSVLCQQTARTLLNFVDDVEQERDSKTKDSNKFLMNISKYTKSVGPYINIDYVDDMKIIQTIEEILGLLVYLKLKEIRNKIGKNLEAGDDMIIIWNEKCQNDLIQVTYLYTNTINYFFAKEIVETNRFTLNSHTKTFFRDLVSLYAMNLVKNNFNDVIALRIVSSHDKLLNWIEKFLQSKHDILKTHLVELRETAFYSEENIGTVRNFKNWNIGNSEQAVLKEYSKNAQNIMKSFNSYSKL